MKKISFTIVVILGLFFGADACAQLKVPFSQTNLHFYDMPYEVVYPMPFRTVSLICENPLIPERVFRDFQCKSFYTIDPQEEVFGRSVYGAFHISGSANILCVYSIDIPEVNTIYLIIADDNGYVHDYICAEVNGYYNYAKQFRILDEKHILVYSIIPSTSESIDIEKFARDRSASFIGRIKTETYSIRNNKFILDDTKYSKEQVIRSLGPHPDLDNKIWERLDLSE